MDQWTGRTWQMHIRGAMPLVLALVLRTTTYVESHTWLTASPM